MAAKQRRTKIPTTEDVLAQQEQQAKDRRDNSRIGGDPNKPAEQKPATGSALIPLGASSVTPEKAAGLARYAKSSGPRLFGDLLRHDGKAGGYAAGPEKTKVKIGRVLVAIVPETYAGHVKWRNGEMVGQDYVPASDFVADKHRALLDEQDVSQWAKDELRRPVDPWREAAMIPMIDPNTRQEFTFSSSNFGGVGAVKRLVNTYNEQIAAAPETTRGCLPVIQLKEHWYMAKNKAHGKIWYPIFEGLDWVRASDLLLPPDPGEGEEPPPNDDGQLPLAG